MKVLYPAAAWVGTHSEAEGVLILLDPQSPQQKAFAIKDGDAAIRIGNDIARYGALLKARSKLATMPFVDLARG